MPGNFFDQFDPPQQNAPILGPPPLPPKPISPLDEKVKQADLILKGLQAKKTQGELDTLQQQRNKVGQSMTAAVGKIDQQVKHIDDLLAHPGLPLVTGPFQGRMPTGINDLIAGTEHLFGSNVNASDPETAQSFIDQIGANAVIAELQDMRANSPTGGAVGQVSNYEDKMFRDAAARLRQSQGDSSFVKALQDYKNELLTGRKRLQDAYKNDFGVGLPDAVPSAPSGPVQPKNKAINFSDLPAGR